MHSSSSSTPQPSTAQSDTAHPGVLWPAGPDTPPPGGSGQTAAGSVAGHRDAVLELLALHFNRHPLDSGELPLAEARGRILAADVPAAGNLPPFANSQMDGYAVRAADLAVVPAAPGGAGHHHAGTGPGTWVELAVAPMIPAGTSPAPLRPGTAAPIMTGAMLPDGADAVVPIEQAVPDTFFPTFFPTAQKVSPAPTPAVPGGNAADRRVRLPANVPAGQFVRSAGSDIAAGVQALAAGTLLGPGQLGLLAALGQDGVMVQARPRVLLLTTGDEVVEPGVPLAAGQIHDANSTLLRTLLEEAGAQVLSARVLADSPREFLRLLHADLEAHSPDLVISSGGISKGAFEVVRQGLAAEDVRFLSVAMQPGGPQGLGRVAGVPFLGFPGNPVSSVVSFEMFLRPALGRLTGFPRARTELRGILAEPAASPRAKHQVRRGRYLPAAEPGRPGRVELIGGPGSHLVHALASSNALVHLPAGVESVPAGGEVTVWLLE